MRITTIIVLFLSVFLFHACSDDGLAPRVEVDNTPEEVTEIEVETETENTESENTDTETDNSQNEGESTESDSSQDDNTETETESAFDKAPEFTLTTTEGNVINSTEFDGKLLVIFFFGNNCPPCIGIGPDVEQRLHKDLEDVADYDIIGFDQWDGNEASVNSFQRKTGVEFPLGLKGSTTAKDFDSTYDRLVVVNRKGEIIYRGNSIVSNNIDEVVALVKDLTE